MFKKENILIALVSISLILGVVGLFGDNKQSDLGGATNLDSLELSGTLSATGAVSGAAATFTGISTLATTSVTSLCVYNGTEFTKITFSGATPAYATSTTCL
jgi:hypothetical protein